MSKLYPPYVEESLPAFTKTATSCILVVPFQLNRAVGRNEFNRIYLRLKTVQSGALLCDGEITSTINFDHITGHWKAVFDLSHITAIQTGAYYKVQIAFGDVETPDMGYYSTISLIKCTSQPNVTIKNLDALNTSNTHVYEYTGLYSQAHGDRTEKVYSYRFDLYDENNSIIASSGNQLHNTSNDTSKSETCDTWTVTKTLKPGYWYGVQYTVTTLNNLIVASPVYKIMQIDTVDFNIGAHLSALMQSDDGYIDVWLKPDSTESRLVRGSFLLTRASETDHYENWEELYRFELVGERPDKHLWQDFTVQQGVKYKYSIQAYNDNGLYSSRSENIEGPITADFEDMFLFDGERQLNIRFNPQVSSFKTTLMESKIDTIGGQFPFIVRGGNVNYKEFPISGLISLLADKNELFMTGIQNNGRETSRLEGDSNIDYTSGTNLTAKNFYHERQFKLEVLNWLNNGQPKLFRSPGEGNYIVSIMGVSLAPTDALGRMLHTFSAQAVEIAECNFANLNKYGFAKSLYKNYHEMQIDQYAVTSLFGNTTTPAINSEYNFTSGAYFISIANQYTSSLILRFYFLDGSVVEWDVHNVTGQFNIPINESPVVKIVHVAGEIEEEATITFGQYSTNINNNFSYITKVDIEDRVEQRIGGNIEENIIDELQDIRQQTGRFYYIKLTPRYVYDSYEFDGQYYWDEEKINPIITWDCTALYNVKNTMYWLDGAPTKRLSSTPGFKAQLNGDTYLDLSRTVRADGSKTSARFEAVTDIDKVHTLKIDTGVLLDMVYQLKTIEYTVEAEDSLIQSHKQQWENSKIEYDTAVAVGEPIAIINDRYRTMTINYNRYIERLAQVLEMSQGGIIDAI